MDRRSRSVLRNVKNYFDRGMHDAAAEFVDRAYDKEWKNYEIRLGRKGLTHEERRDLLRPCLKRLNFLYEVSEGIAWSREKKKGQKGEFKGE